MINQAIMTGYLTKDVELRRTGTGTAVTNFIVAVNRPFKNNNGEREADFINCVAWDKTAELMSQYTQKGSRIGIRGRIQTRNYENNQGQRVYVTEVVVREVQFLDNKKDGQQSQGQAPQQSNYSPSGADPVNITDDDLPF